MSAEENKLLVRRYLEEVVNAGNVAEVEKFISGEYVEVYKNVRHAIGLDGARKHVLGVRQTYPDLHITVEQQIAEGDWVATRITVRGTHQGEWMGIKPTGKKVEITGVNLDRVVDGKIVEHGGAANLLEAMLEIGAVRICDGS